MPETRVIKKVYGIGGYDTTKPNNNIIEQITTEITDEELAEEVETLALEKANKLIDQIDSLAKAKVFLKRLCARLIRKGLLP